MEPFIHEINKAFKDKNFPENFVEAHINNQGDFCLRIGWRDIQLKATGEFIGCGSDIELMKKYTVIEN